MKNNSLSRKLIGFVLAIIIMPIIFLVLIGIPNEESNNIFGTVLGLIILISIPIFFISMIFLSYIQKMIIHPIKELLNGLNEVSLGNYKISVDYHQQDEIGDLICKFNEMTHALNESILMNKKLEQEKQAMINAISHDLKTPLTVIQSHVDALEDHVALSKEQEQSYYRIIHNKINQLDERINELRNFSIYENSEDKISTTICVRRSMDLLVSELKESYRLYKLNFTYTNLVKEKTQVYLDNKDLGVVIENLFFNAIKYNDKDEPSIKILLREDEKSVYIQVEDNGIGINEYDLNKIFQPLFKVDNSRLSVNEGMGLGLSIVREIIKKAQGSIMVESEVLKGTVFFIELPKA